MTTGERTAEVLQLGPYRLRGRIGEGGMGVVHLGLDPAGRAVAVKVLRAHVAHDPDARARLAREVSSLRRVRHPLVAEVLDADVDGMRPYVVTRFVPGPGLDTVVRDRGPLGAEQLLRLGRGLSSALRAIHAVGVVHRDLKPANVLMLDGDPVVIDFGIAHVADDVRLTSVGLVMGTPGYLSPEVIDGEPVTQATDWWGWAATIAYAASGRPPFGRGPVDVIIDRVRRSESDLDGVDVRLRPLLHAALNVDPARRPVDAQVLDALDRYAAGAHATVPVPVSQPVSQTRALPAARTVSDLVPRQQGLAAQEGLAPPARVASRRTVLVALLVALVGAAAAWPAMTAAAFLVLCVLARTVERNRFTLAQRRYERGPRRSDVLVAVVTTPWHLVRSVLTSALAALLPALLGAATAFTVGVAVPQPSGSPAPGSAPAVAAGALVALVAAWWGPGGGSLRRGSRTVVRAIVPPSGQVVLVLALLAVGAAFALWAVQAGGPQWAPLQALTR